MSLEGSWESPGHTQGLGRTLGGSGRAFLFCCLTLAMLHLLMDDLTGWSSWYTLFEVGTSRRSEPGVKRPCEYEHPERYQYP